MGIIPYYMFMARDTGAQAFFDVPMAKAHKIYSDALRNCSGLIRTGKFKPLDLYFCIVIRANLTIIVVSPWALNELHSW